MAIRSLAQARRCYEEGRYQETAFRKVPAIASSPGAWSDLSIAPGNPRPNYYTGAVKTATVLTGANGFFHGGDVSPLQKYLHKVMIGSNSAGHAPAHYKVLDYLLFYPLIDMDATGDEEMFNVVTLPRYSDGVGVEAMLVATNPYIGSAQFYISYTCAYNQARESMIETCNNGGLIGSVVHSGLPTLPGSGAFIRRPAGCPGIKRVNSINFLAPNGGLAALVLVKPLTDIVTNEITATCEYDFITMKHSMPKVEDGGYVNMIGNSGTSWIAAPVTGTINFIWG